MKANRADSISGDVSATGAFTMLAAWGLWSLDPILIYQVGASVSRTLLSGVSMLIAGLLFAPGLLRAARSARLLSRRNIVLMALLAILFTGVSEVCYTGAVRHMHPGLVSAVLRSQMFFAVLFAAYYFRERLNGIEIAGMAIILLANLGILAGALFSGAGRDASALGWTLAILAALLFSGGTITSKELLFTLTPREVVAARLLLAGALTLFFHLLTEGIGPALALSGSQWALLAAKGVLTSGCAFLLYYIALKHMKVYIASAMETFAPVLTILVSFSFLGKPVCVSDLLSAIALLFGAAVVIVGTRMRAGGPDQ